MYSYNNCVQERQDDYSVSYILNNNKLLYETGFKVLDYQSNKALLRCQQMYQNGCLRLMYNYSGLIPLQKILNECRKQDISKIIYSITEIIDETKENGFLKCENIDMDANRIFISPEDRSVKMICLPLIGISKYPDLEAVKIALFNALSPVLIESGYFTVEELEELLLIQNKPSQPAVQDEPIQQTESIDPTPSRRRFSWLFGKKQRLVLSSSNIQPKIEFVIGSDPFIIGKSSSGADGALDQFNAVSRRHCRIYYDDGKFFVNDFNSTNGTYVNDNRIIGNEALPLNKGDRLRIADIIFIVQ